MTFGTFLVSSCSQVVYPQRRVKSFEIFLFAREVILFAQFCYLIFRLENDIMHNFEFGIQVMLITYRDLLCECFNARNDTKN